MGKITPPIKNPISSYPIGGCFFLQLLLVFEQDGHGYTFGHTSTWSRLWEVIDGVVEICCHDGVILLFGEASNVVKGEWFSYVIDLILVYLIR